VTASARRGQRLADLGAAHVVRNPGDAGGRFSSRSAARRSPPRYRGSRPAVPCCGSARRASLR
jgi:hypothetical protein